MVSSAWGKYLLFVRDYSLDGLLGLHLQIVFIKIFDSTVLYFLKKFYYQINFFDFDWEGRGCISLQVFQEVCVCVHSKHILTYYSLLNLNQFSYKVSLGQCGDYCRDFYCDQRRDLQRNKAYGRLPRNLSSSQHGEVLHYFFFF